MCPNFSTVICTCTVYLVDLSQPKHFETRPSTLRYRLIVNPLPLPIQALPSPIPCQGSLDGLAIAYVATAKAVFAVAIARPIQIRAGAACLWLDILMASGYRKDASVLPTPFDALIAMLVK